MIIKLNNIDITSKLKLEYGYVAKDNFTPDNLNSVTYTFYFKEEVDIKVSDILEIDTKQWLVGTVDNSISQKQPIKYKAIILCIELTKLLERFIVSPCAFTNKNDYLMDQVLKVLDKAVLRRNDEASIFTFHTVLTDLLAGVKGEDFFFNEMTTLREILDEMLSTLKYRIHVSKIEDGKILLGALNLNYISPIKTLPNNGLIAKRTIQSLENYGKAYEIMVDNVNPQNEREALNEYNLSWENWQTLKPITTDVVTTNNAQLITSFPIEEIKEVKLQWEVKVKLIYDAVGNEETGYMTATEDLSNMFLEEEIYNALALDEQEKHFSYSKGSKSIGVLKTFKVLLFPQSTIENRMETNTTVNQQLEDMGFNLQVFDNTYPFYQIMEQKPTTATFLSKTLYFIKYNSYQNYHISVSKDGDFDFKGGNVLQNPDKSQIDIERFGDHLIDIAKGKGNKEIHYDYILKNKDRLLSLGSRILFNDNSIMTLLTREYAIFNDYVKAHYVFEVNYAAPVNAKLNRERRAFVNPINSFVKRDILIKDKAIIRTEKITSDKDKGFIKYKVLNDTFVNTLVHTEDAAKPLDLGVMYLSSVNYALQLHSKAIANSIRWHFECFDNYSVGYSTGVKTIGGYTVNLNPYVNSVGELENVELNLARSFLQRKVGQTFDEKLEAGIKAPVYTPVMNVDVEVVQTNKTKFKISKDTFEQLTFTYQLEFTQFSECQVIIGNYLTKYIELANGNKLNGDAYIWVSNERYFANDTKNCKGTMTAYQPAKDVDGDVINPMPTAELMTYNAWAIGTNTGKLLVAVNNLKTDKHLLALQIAPDKINI